jgi:hypothetical protein
VAVVDVTGSGTGGRGLRIIETSSSKSSGVYTVEIDSSAQTSNVSAAGAFKIDVNSGRALTVDGQGRTGIGTASPQQILFVQPASDVNFGISNSGTSLRLNALNNAADTNV